MMNTIIKFNEIINLMDQNHIPQKNFIRANNDIDAIKTWLFEYKSRYNTFTSYRQTSERFLLWCMQNNLNLKIIKREDIQDYQDFLLAPTPHDFWCGKSLPRSHSDWKPFVKGLSNSSIKLNIQILTTMYEYLVQSGYLINNPFNLIKLKSNMIINKGIDRYLTHKEWNYIVDAIERYPRNNKDQEAKYQRIKWIFSLLYLTGCRRSEIINSKMSDFINKRNNWWLRVVGKGNKYGEIPVTNELLKNLIDYRRHLNLPDFPSAIENNVPLITNLKNKKSIQPISDSMLYKLIKIACLQIANDLKHIDPSSAFIIEKVSTHWLRHTSATHQVDAGIDIRVVKENLRHSMLETTMKYQHTEAEARHIETNKKFGIK
jgi:site-specific recombinase XerD